MITIGADPEVFLAYKGSEKIASAIGVVGGSKRRPRKVSDHIKVQEDNVLAEYNITPAKTKQEFVTFCLEGLDELSKIVEPKGYNIRILASADIDVSELSDPKAYIFGCDPDFNAWTQGINDKPVPVANFRSAGGHVHVGGIKQEKVIDTIRAMDLFLGVPSVIKDSDKKRKMLYGKAGAFRPKKYGVEYRTLSNFWLQDESLIEWVYEATMRAVEWSNSNTIANNSPLSFKIQNAINQSDIRLVSELVKEFNL